MTCFVHKLNVSTVFGYVTVGVLVLLKLLELPLHLASRGFKNWGGSLWPAQLCGRPSYGTNDTVDCCVVCTGLTDLTAP